MITADLAIIVMAALGALGVTEVCMRATATGRRVAPFIAIGWGMVGAFTIAAIQGGGWTWTEVIVTGLAAGMLAIATYDGLQSVMGAE